MKQWVGSVLAAGVMALGGAMAQGFVGPLQPQIEALHKLNRANLLSRQQIEDLLPQLREVRTMSSLSPGDAALYAARITEILTDVQRLLVAELTDPGQPPFTGGGGGSGSSSGGFSAWNAASSDPAGQTASLDEVIVGLSERLGRPRASATGRGGRLAGGT
ncbi:MAG: hypothetical protein SFU83_06205 [Meiothermus sp.]|nr:hypothetical protein [Meiothermus sp.]